LIEHNQRDLVDKIAKKFAGTVVSTGPSWDREMTPLRTGIKSGVEMVEKLLEHGAVPQLSDITFAINSRADGQVVSDLLEVAINGTFPYTNVQLRQIAQVDFNSGSRNGKLEQWAELLLEAGRIELYEWAVNRALWTCRLVPRSMRFTVARQAGIKLNKQDEEKQQRGITAKLSDLVCKVIKLLLKRVFSERSKPLI